MTINKSKHNPDTDYLRGLINNAGISQREAARRIGIDERTLRRYLTLNSNKSYVECPYVVQYALEGL